jgi:hypothetical protein
MAAPVESTSWHSSWTVPSTHPPDTLPSTSPVSDTAMVAPGARGALPLTETTVARAKRVPVRSQALSRAAISRMAVTRHAGRPAHAASTESASASPFAKP